ncbi:MAG: amino acid permease [Pirellulales bacterium]|nr:amino acid permease [Pirellulales bacterium]
MWRKQIAVRKSFEVLAAEMAGEHRLKRVLGPISLTSLGVGAIIGAGIFVVTGRAAALDAGPAIIISYMVAALGCAFAALCYAEFAAMAPVAGSAYTYAYATLGELFAWIIGWDLILEYAMSCAVVASAWTGYLNELLAAAGLPRLPAQLCTDPLTKIPGTETYGLLNLPAAIIVLIVTTVLVVGIRESATTNAVMVVVKLAVVLFVIALGVWYVQSSNWTGIPVTERVVSEQEGSKWGILGLVGVDRLLQPLDDSVRSPFAPYGFSGIMVGAAIVFFAFIGFDSVSTHAEEARNPQRDVPIAIIVSLIGCTILYVAVAAVITGMVPYPKIDLHAPIADAFGRVARENQSVLLRGATFFIALGALAGMSSVMLVTFLSQARVFMAMSRDGLLPQVFGQIHPRFATPHLATMLTGACISVTAAFTNIVMLGEMVNIGTLLAFVAVCASVLILRRTRPDVPRPFRCPALYVVAPMGIVVNLIMMLFLPLDTWIRLAVWLVIGLVIYFLYSRWHSVMGQALWKEYATQGFSPTDAPLKKD